MLLEDGEFERLIDTMPNERMEALRRYPWPGNVRALQNIIERAMTAWRVRGAGGAAALLGLKPTTLEARMKKLGVHRPDRPPSSRRL